MKMSIKILQGNCLETLSSLEEKSVNTCVTSPPYWGLRDYGNGDQLGQEETPEQFTENLVKLFREVRRVLRDDGTVWLNLGDSYCGTGHKGDTIDSRYEGRNGQKVALNNKIQGLKSKDLVGIPWRVAFALQADGWYLRQDIIWHKPNPMPESVRTDAQKHMSIFFCLVSQQNIITTMKLLRKTARNLQKIV
jgi:DNA modification methylase